MHKKRDFKQEKWMTEKFKENISASSKAVQSLHLAQSPIVLLITSFDNFRKLLEECS